MDRRVAAVTYFVIVNLLFCALALENNLKEIRQNVASNDEVHQKSNFTERKWISQLFYDAEMAFGIHSNASADCRRDFNTYLQHLNNQSIWAVRSKFLKIFFSTVLQWCISRSVVLFWWRVRLVIADFRVSVIFVVGIQKSTNIWKIVFYASLRGILVNMNRVCRKWSFFRV